MRLYSPPFIISPTRASTLSLTARESHRDPTRVLFCGYCLSHDQRFLLASCTDNRGELLETCVINIEVPNRNRRRKASARRVGLQKLWDFLLGVISTSSASWRLVVGKFGRLGHSELLAWSGLLSRKNLQRISKCLSDTCTQCSGCDYVMCVRSACLVSMETHPSIVVLADSPKTEERQASSRCQLSTPRDSSVTHILVLPTSATASVGDTH